MFKLWLKRLARKLLNLVFKEDFLQIYVGLINSHNRAMQTNTAHDNILFQLKEMYDFIKSYNESSEEEKSKYDNFYNSDNLLKGLEDKLKNIVENKEVIISSERDMISLISKLLNSIDK